MFFVPEWMGDVCTRTWANMAMANVDLWRDVQHNGSQWVACGESGAGSPFNSSSDGVTWATGTGGSYLAHPYLRVRWNGTTWAALSTYDGGASPGRGMTSTNGTSWTNQDVAYLGVNVAKNLSVMGTQFVASGNLATQSFFTSTDGFTFTSGGNGLLPYNIRWGVSAYSGSVEVILSSGGAGDDNRAAYSTNQGASWTASNVLPYSGTWDDVFWTGRCFFARDGAVNAARSYDGITWTAVTMPAPTSILDWGRPCANLKGTIFIPMWYKTGNVEHTVLYASVDDGDNWCLNTLSQSGQWGCSGSDGTRIVVCANNITGAANAKGSYADPS